MHISFRKVFTAAALASPLVWFSCRQTATVSNTPAAQAEKNVNGYYWSDISQVPGGFAMSSRVPSKYRLLHLDLPLLRARLAGITKPEEKEQIMIPMPDSTNRVYEVSIPAMRPESRNVPGQATTYTGTALNNIQSTIRISLSARGFYAQIRDIGGPVSIEPCQPGDTLHYFSYRRSDLPRFNNQPIEKPVTVPKD
jgi:hypothetical protein